MKRIVLLTAIVVAFAMSVSAQLALGWKVGANMKTLNWESDENNTTSDYNVGFVVGGLCEYISPKTGIGFDVSIQWSRDKFKAKYDYGSNGIINYDFETDYGSIPVNLKWKPNIGAVGRIIRPIIYTGPEMSFVLHSEIADDYYQKKTVQFSWNFGIGIELFDKWQINAHYGLGLNDCFYRKNAGYDINFIRNMEIAKQEYFYLTASYLHKF